MAGPERKSKVISKKEKKIVAYHESGHALIALLLKSADSVHKVSIVPRGHAALGYTLQLPLEDRYLISKSELIQKITILLAGRCAEEIAFNEVTTGAQNDFEVATGYAKRMVCEFGMSERMGTATFGKHDKQVFLGRDLMAEKDYSEKTAIMIDEEVCAIINGCKKSASVLLKDNKNKLEALANKLLVVEVLDGDEVCEVVGIYPEKNEEESADSKDDKKDDSKDKSKAEAKDESKDKSKTESKDESKDDVEKE